MTKRTNASLKGLGLAVITSTLLFGSTFPDTVVAQDQGTPAASYSCASATTVPATPAMDTGNMEMDMSAEVEFDQLYIDMMLPHHGSIIALAQAA